MSSVSDANLIALLNNVSSQLTRYFGIFIFVFGVVGNTVNILVLSQRPLHSNSCAWLFLASSIAYLISLFSGLIFRFLSTWNADLTSTNQFICKFKTFVVFTSLTIGFWLLMLATVDRWLSSSTITSRRQRSTLKNAQRGTIVIVILSVMIELQNFICYEANLTNTPVKCYTKTEMCGIISDVLFALVTILFPLLLMFIFGLIIISNVRQSQSRLQPMNTTTMDDRVAHNTATASTGRSNQQKKTDRQLLIMLLVQVFLMLLLTLPFALSKLYSTITRNTPKLALQNTTENFIFNLLLLFLYIACGMPFYVYTLCGGNVFRNALFSLMTTLHRKMLCRRR